MSTASRFAWLDGLSTVAMCLAALALLPAHQAATWGVALRIGIVTVVCIVAFYYNDLYNFEAPHDLGQLFSRLCRALGVSALVLAITYLMFPEMIVGGNLASYALLLTLLAVLTLRVVVYALAKRAPFTERVLILGGGRFASDLAQQIEIRPDLALRVVGFLTPAAGPVTAPRLGDYGDVGDIVRRLRPDRIVVAMPDRRGNLPVSDLLSCRIRGIRVEEGTRVFEDLTGRLAVESLSPSTLVFGDGFRVSRRQRFLKRVMSVAVALVALIVAAPAMAVIAAAIKLESRGPVFFIQERVGLGGRRFSLIKFRTMREADWAGDSTWGRDNASRVTRLGAVLRRYRLDELPQCLNILKGDMSLVGPRPEMASNVATFSAVIPFYDFRHEVSPGLTGWAQIKAGYAMSTEEVTQKLCYDLYYIKHMSVLFDLQILVDTVKFVLSGRRPG
jgi:sugar transferase (PEP-CTERM system associated)